MKGPRVKASRARLAALGLAAIAMLPSCQAAKEAGEALAVGFTAAGVGLVAGPTGAVFAGAAMHLVFKAADGSDLQEDVNEKGLQQALVPDTYMNSAKKLLYYLIGFGLLLLFIDRKWLFSLPLKAFNLLVRSKPP